MKNKSIPNPGSKEAIKLGCKCPVLDNSHGLGMEVRGMKLYWFTENCPIHTIKEKEDTKNE